MTLPIATILLVMVNAADPTPIGLWEGKLEVGPVKLRLAFKIDAKPDGTFTGTMDSPDQGVKGIPLTEVKFADKKLAMLFKEGGAEYAGTMADDGKSFKGEWKQSGQTFELALAKVEKLTEAKRPQIPTKPYPYHEEEVTFENSAANITLAGTFTKPKDGGPFAAVVLITGSGPQDRDESLMGHKPFLVLADHLTRHGIAVLRCDDRGVGKSKGKHSTATTADFATDAWAAVQYLKTRSDVDGKRIGLAGHSEGGLIAPMVAADHADAVGFIVLLAGPGLPGDQVLGDQIAALFRANKASDHEIDLRRLLQQQLIAIAKQDGEPAELHKQMTAAAEAFDRNLSPGGRKLLEKGSTAKMDKATEEKLAAQQFSRLTSNWMRYFLKHDPRPVLAKVRCPVLAINGEKDLQVTPKENLPEIEKALTAAGNKSVVVKELPGLNHLFQHSKTGLVTEYAEIEETFAPAALDIIAIWIKERK